MIVVNEIIHTIETVESPVVVVENSETNVIVSLSQVVPTEIIYTVEVNGVGIQGATGDVGINPIDGGTFNQVRKKTWHDYSLEED